MPTMNISLTGALASFVESEVESGRYASASELVRESLRMLEHEKDVEAEKRAILKAAVQAGLDQAKAGDLSPRSFEEIVSGALGEMAS